MESLFQVVRDLSRLARVVCVDGRSQIAARLAASIPERPLAAPRLPTAESDPGIEVNGVASRAALAWMLSTPTLGAGAEKVIDHFLDAARSGCMHCHQGVELIREPGSEMLSQMMQRGRELGDPAGCVVRHSGNPDETHDKSAAHGGQDSYADPGSPWINEKTCGPCHPVQVEVQWRSLMMTEAGKIQGVCWAFGSLTGYEHRWANYAVANPQTPEDRLGTEVYRAYMERLSALEPNVFVDRHQPLPEAPTDLAKLARSPNACRIHLHAPGMSAAPTRRQTPTRTR